ncbi:MAG TPA: efflux RND transporter periplasmic adaptor subunit, partial [Bacteroidota bacterium]
MRTQFRLALRALPLFGLLFIAVSCRRTSGDEDEGSLSGVKATVSVKTVLISEGNAVVSVSAFGKTDALKKEKIYAPIAGRIISLKAFEGTEVKKGDVLALIQTKESQSAILGAESMVQTARTPEQRAEAEQMLRLARSTQNSVSILARFDGVVASRSVSEGELVAENAELLTVIDLSTIDFVADVQLRDVASIRVNQQSTIRFQSLPDRTFPAVVEAVSPQSDPQNQTVKVR